uniref:Rad60/SUMO-like domain-containing protein n=1 Tax=Hemiselmis andersenii TaxID=464988 RepID=A0A6T8JNL8_HEMAN|mmetsp:Transcript_31656/g.77174  ORF Transcript_31656/g.77174 Transcript_31656/m.77174 type:complete len:364 (+) Transcript_31656:371-1462(+)
MVQDAALNDAMKRYQNFKAPAPVESEEDDGEDSDLELELKVKRKGKKPAKKAPPQASSGGSSSGHASAPPSQQGGASKRKSKHDSDSDDEDELRQVEAEYKKRKAQAPDPRDREILANINVLMKNIEEHKKEIVVDEVEIVETPTKPPPPSATGRGARSSAGAAAKSPSVSPAVPKAVPGKRFIFTVKQEDIHDATARRINENDPMSKIMEAYAKHNNLDVSCLQFYDPDGTPVKPDQLCKTLVDLEDEPEPNELTCTFVKGKAPAAAAAPAAERPGRRFIFTVKQKDVADENKMRIHEDDEMSKIMKAFCKRHQLDEDSILFSFDGATIKPTQAARSLDPEEEPEVNQIDAAVKTAGKAPKR